MAKDACKRIQNYTKCRHFAAMRYCILFLEMLVILDVASEFTCQQHSLDKMKCLIFVKISIMIFIKGKSIAENIKKNVSGKLRCFLLLLDS